MLHQFKELFHRRREVLQQAINRSEEAQALLNNPLIESFFRETEEQTMALWKKTVAEDEEGREKAYLFYQMMNKFRSYLTLYVEHKAEAVEELERLMREPDA